MTLYLDTGTPLRELERLGLGEAEATDTGSGSCGGPYDAPYGSCIGRCCGAL